MLFAAMSSASSVAALRAVVRLRGVPPLLCNLVTATLEFISRLPCALVARLVVVPSAPLDSFMSRGL